MCGEDEMNLKSVCETIRCLSNLRFDMIKAFPVTATEEEWLDFAEADKAEAIVKYQELFNESYEVSRERIEALLKNKTWGTKFSVGDAVANKASPYIYAVITDGYFGKKYFLRFFDGSEGWFNKEDIIAKPITVSDLPNGTYFKLKNGGISDRKYLRVKDKELDGFVNLQLNLYPTSFLTCGANSTLIPLPA